MKRVAVLGTLVWDRIWHPAGPANDPVEQWGGIAYSLAALSAACPPGWVARPILRIGSDLADSALSFLAGLPNLDTSAVTVTPEPNNRVELRYLDAANRTERLTGGVPGWRWDDLADPLDSADALYVNFISGMELGADAVGGLRRIDIPTYADLHSLFLGPPHARARLPARPDDWARWVAAFDAIQVNETELALMAGDELTPDALLERLPAMGPAVAFVTRGPRGADRVEAGPAGGADGWPASLSFRNRARDAGTPGADAGSSPPSAPGGDFGARGAEGPGRPVRVTRIARGLSVATGDPTGCGDVWGAVNFASLLGGCSLDESMERANVAAAARLTAGGIDGLRHAVFAALGQRDTGV